jgi:hypothetical protein
MKMRTQLLSIAAVLAIMATLLAVPGVSATTPQDDATEDIVYMADGRILHGEIVSEDASTIVFEYRHEQFGAIKMTLNLDDISKIDRDVAREAPAEVADDADMSDQSAMATDAEVASRSDENIAKVKQVYGATLASESANVPRFYIVPMSGQMGTDVHPVVYRDIVEDIKQVNPDLVVLVMNSTDISQGFMTGVPQDEQSIMLMDEFIELADLFKDELEDFPQVLWVQDAMGMSSMVALAWSDMYMSSDALFGGLSDVIDKSGADQWSDADVRAKMMAAWMGHALGFAIYGDYASELCYAMMQPEHRLTASFRGREVIWSLDGAGQYIVDVSDQATVNFAAKAAEDLCFADGIADTLDDLALLLGYREYALAGSSGYDLFFEYKSDWRDALAQAKRAHRDFGESMERAVGDQQLGKLGQARKAARRVLSLMNQYDAVRIRMGTDLGETIEGCEARIHQLTEQMQAIAARDSGRAGGGRAGGGRGQGGGRSGGPTGGGI